LKNKNGQKGKNAGKRKSADIKADLLRDVIKPVQIRSSLGRQVSFGQQGHKKQFSVFSN